MTQHPPPARFSREGWTKRPKWLRLPPIDPLPTTADLPILPSFYPPILRKNLPKTSDFLPKRRLCHLLLTWRVWPAVVVRPRDCSSSPSAALAVTAVEFGWLGGLRGRAETAAARRGLLAKARASEDAARGSRSATHRPTFLPLIIRLAIPHLAIWVHH